MKSVMRITELKRRLDGINIIATTAENGMFLINKATGTIHTIVRIGANKLEMGAEPVPVAISNQVAAAVRAYPDSYKYADAYFCA